jgi:hypothetical protein
VSVDTVTSSETTTHSSDVNADGYKNVDVTQIDGGDIPSHTSAIKEFTSQKDIQNYIDKNIIQFFKSQSPPNLSAIDRTINDLIISLAEDNEKLAAVVYHAVDTMPNNNLIIQDTDLTGKRKIVFGSSTKAISDSFFNEIATASQDVAAYTNNYFNTSPTTDTSKTDTSTTDTSTTDTSTTDTSKTDTSTTDTSTKDTQKKDTSTKDTQKKDTAFSEEILAFLPDDTTLEDLDETLMIDIKTGKKINPTDYDQDKPEEVAKLKKIMENAITIKTNGHHEGLADGDNAQKITDALVKYITRPYEQNVSEDGLQDIMDNLSLEMSGHIFKNVQDTILKSSNPADIKKLTNFKSKINDNGLDGIIAEVYNYNYLGGNTSDPSLFLMDIFKNDPSKKLNTINIDQIATVLSAQLDDFLSDTNEPPDKKPLDFISQALNMLSAGSPDNLTNGHIETLLQKIASKTSKGKPDDVKDILSDLAINSGIDTIKTVSIQTGHTLMSNFGEFTYTNDTGTSTTFSSDDTTSGGFNTFTNDMIQLIQGGGTLVKEPNDEATKAVIASQTADMIMALSPTQQKAIIQKFIDSGIDSNILEHFIPLASDTSTNLSKIIEQIKLQENIDDLNSATSVQAKADIFSDIINAFKDPKSSIEMDNLIHGLMQNQTTEPKSFLGLNVTELSQFNALLTQKLQENGGTTNTSTTPETIIGNIKTALSKEAITFKDSDNKTVYAEDVLVNGSDIYLDTIKNGMDLNNAKLLLNSLTPAEKSDPSFFTNILSNKNSFNSETEFTNFITSIQNILTALSEKTDPEFNVLKTSLTNALLTNKPTFNGFECPADFKIGDDPENKKTDGSFLAFLTRNGSAVGITDDALNALDLKAIIANTDYVNHIVTNLNDVDSETWINTIKTGLGADTSSISTFNTNITNCNTIAKKEKAIKNGESSAETYEEALANFKALDITTITAENFDQFEKELLAMMKFKILLSKDKKPNEIYNEAYNKTPDETYNGIYNKNNISNQSQVNNIGKIFTDLGITLNSNAKSSDPKQAAILELFANASVNYVIDAKKDKNNEFKNSSKNDLLRQLIDAAGGTLDQGEQDQLLAHRVGYAIYRLDDAEKSDFGNVSDIVSGASFSLKNNVHEDKIQSGYNGDEYSSQYGNTLNIIATDKKTLITTPPNTTTPPATPPPNTTTPPATPPPNTTTTPPNTTTTPPNTTTTSTDTTGDEVYSTTTF